jgi:hypothetical protein
MASLSDLRTDLRLLLDESDNSNTNFTDTELNGYLNKALRKTAVELEWPIAVATATTATSQAQYSLPDNFMLLLKVFVDGKPLDVTDLEDIAIIHPNYRSAAADIPTLAYRADNNQIGLYPPPNLANAGKTILMEYIKYAATITADADVPDLSAAIQDLLPFYAALLAMLRAGNYKTADYFRGLYNAELKSLKPKVQKFAEEFSGFRWDGGGGDNSDA